MTPLVLVLAALGLGTIGLALIFITGVVWEMLAEDVPEVADRIAMVLKVVSMWIGLSILCYVVLWFNCRPAHAAVRVPIAWTVPDTLPDSLGVRHGGVTRRLEAIYRRSSDGAINGLNLWADSAADASPTIPPPGEPMGAWVLVSQDWRAGGTMVWLRGCNGAGCGGWSNAVVYAAGCPDTVFALVRPDPGALPLPAGEQCAKDARWGRVGWRLAPGDSVAPARIVHFEDVQRASAARLCELYGYWCLRGAREVCE
jgi:hypothetical protein